MKLKRRKGPLWPTGLLIAFLSAAGLIVQPAMAGEKTPDVVNLGTITVMESQPGVEITTEKTIIRMDEFKKPGEVRTLTDVLTEIGGVDVQRINPMMASPGDEVSIRGLNEGRMVIEIDGRRINHTGHVGRYIVDWSTLNMDDVDHIEIIRGGHSVLHPFAIAGVINIVTKKERKRADLKPEVNVKAGYGKFETYNMAAAINGGASKLLDYNFSASRQETDGYLRNNFQETDAVNGHLNFYLPHDATLSIGAKYSEVLYGLPVLNDPSRSDYDSDYPVLTNGADELRHFPSFQTPGSEDPNWEKHTTYLDGILQVPVGPGTINIHGFLTSGERWLDFYNPQGVFVEDMFVDDETRGCIAEYRDIDLFDSHKLTVGTEYQELGQPETDPTIFRVKSAYAQDIIQVGDRWTFTPGVRYYHVESDDATESGFFPSLKVDFQATPDTALYAAVSRSYRLPCP